MLKGELLMDYLTELNHGLGAIRAWLDKNTPDWKTAEVSLCFEPHHCQMAVEAVAMDQKMETLDAILTVGVLEDLDPSKPPALPVEASQ